MFGFRAPSGRTNPGLSGDASMKPTGSVGAASGVDRCAFAARPTPL